MRKQAHRLLRALPVLLEICAWKPGARGQQLFSNLIQRVKRGEVGLRLWVAAYNRASAAQPAASMVSMGGWRPCCWTCCRQHTVVPTAVPAPCSTGSRPPAPCRWWRPHSSSLLQVAYCRPHCCSCSVQHWLAAPYAPCRWWRPHSSSLLQVAYCRPHCCSCFVQHWLAAPCTVQVVEATLFVPAPSSILSSPLLLLLRATLACCSMHRAGGGGHTLRPCSMHPAGGGHAVLPAPRGTGCCQQQQQARGCSGGRCAHACGKHMRCLRWLLEHHTPLRPTQGCVHG